MVDDHGPKLYGELASWWPLLSAPADYAEEAAFYRKALSEAANRPLHSLLELGSGGGNNASHLKSDFDMVLVDRSPGMLAVSRALNPECEHAEGDMRTVRLGREFDGVFIHDAICYLTTEADVRQAIATAFVHCQPGGVALFAPDHVRENFQSSTDHGGHDDASRGLRYLEWTWDPDPADSTYVVDFAYLLRGRDGSIRVEHDRHNEGLFARGDWLRWLAAAGFQPRVVPFDHSELEPGSYEFFVCTKPGKPTRSFSMTMALRILTVLLLIVPVFAADPPGFALWKSAELKQRDEALSKKVGPDHSARETLADYQSHRFRLLHRDADGFPEQHDNIVDVVFVQSGEGTLLLGGKMLGQRAGSGTGEFVGTGIEGGERHSLGAGDVMHIPPRIPHSFLVPKGKHITYVLVKFPAP